ncbi:hypothetical protein HF086_007022 [Spodoptera exigua]|uniref:Uncharacterized protein n=1 Tax=Spodoptera exigua TaxID=7107 RepID=A0A922MZB0_SPOEX|nr:hypothetical protein HF086_007022 [Spodoptera exigua]
METSVFLVTMFSFRLFQREGDPSDTRTATCAGTTASAAPTEPAPAPPAPSTPPAPPPAPSHHGRADTARPTPHATLHYNMAFD